MPLSSVLGAQSLVRPGVCTSSTRPASPFEGQVIYETDTDLVSVYNGSAWKSIGRVTASTNGSILQVVSTTKTDTFSTTSTTFTDLTGLSVTITPTSSSSKVFLMGTIPATAATGSSPGIAFQITGGNASNYVGDASGNRIRAATAVWSGTTNANMQNVASLMYLDSPATTSAITYQVQIRTSGSTAYVGRTQTDDNTTQYTRTACTFTAMEIAG